MSTKIVLLSLVVAFAGLAGCAGDTPSGDAEGEQQGERQGGPGEGGGPDTGQEVSTTEEVDVEGVLAGGAR